MSSQPTSIVPSAGTAERIEGSNDLAVPRLGDWFWVQDEFGADSAEELAWLRSCIRDQTAEVREGKYQNHYLVTAQLLMTVTQVGSNYIKLTSPQYKRAHSNVYWAMRVHLDHMEVLEAEPNAAEIIRQRTNQHRAEVARLLSEVNELTRRLGVGQTSLGAGESTSTATSALVRAADNKPVKAFKDELTRAKEKTLPALFREIEEENRKMGGWMTAELLPMRAHVESGMKPLIARIDNRIFNVELYAGLVETTVRVREGEPAAVGEPVHLFQRRHYMDEEFIAGYTAGDKLFRAPKSGMDIRHLDEFSKWLGRKANFERLLPFPRCVVAFRVRRFAASYKWEGGVPAGIIEFSRWENAMRQHNERTFLFMRNGEQLYRLETDVEFGPELFPDEKLQHLTGTLYAKVEHSTVKDVITQGDWEERKKRFNELTATFEARQAAWRTEAKAWCARNRIYGTMTMRDDDGSYYGRGINVTWDFSLFVHRRLLMAQGKTLDEAMKTAKNKNVDRLVSIWNGIPHWTSDGRGLNDALASPLDIKALHAEYHAAYDREHEAQPAPPGDPVDDFSDYAPFTDDNVFYDEIQAWLAARRDEHNRIVLVLQGLLDRSETFHPHPKWELWTEVGFTNALVLHYDSTRALVPTKRPPNWEAFRAGLNAWRKPGSIVAGADVAWRAHEEEEREKRARYDSAGRRISYDRFKRDDNPGPGRIAKVERINRNGEAVFTWVRQTETWRGVEKATKVTWACPFNKLLCLDKFEAGSLKTFFDDPRSRLDYMKWAGLLIAGEDFVAGKWAPEKD